MMFTAGYVRFGRWGDGAIRWHWSLPLAMAFAGQWELRPLSWFLCLWVVMTHQAGHLMSVKRLRLGVIGVDLQGLGGEVRWNGVASPRDQVLLAWSGVLAQLGLLVLAKIALMIAGGTSSPWLVELEHVLVWFNAVLIGLNLLPIPTFDGEVAWKVLSLARGREIPERRSIVLHVMPSRDDEPDEDRIRAEVEAELAELTRNHNEQAERPVRQSRWS